MKSGSVTVLQVAMEPATLANFVAFGKILLSFAKVLLLFDSRVPAV